MTKEYRPTNREVSNKEMIKAGKNSILALEKDPSNAWSVHLDLLKNLVKDLERQEASAEKSKKKNKNKKSKTSE